MWIHHEMRRCPSPIQFFAMTLASEDPIFSPFPIPHHPEFGLGFVLN